MEARERLNAYLTNGSTVYCILRHKSDSGMTRRISFVIFVDNRPIQLDYSIATILDMKPSEKDGLVVRGCGMDMGFHIVNRLSHVLGVSLRHEWL